MTSTSIATAADRQALVERLLSRKRIQRAARPGIPPRADYSPCELSFAQEGLWLAVQLHPRSGAYHIPTRVRVEGPLDVAAVRRSLDIVVSRHEALRTAVTVVDGRPQQCVHPHVRTDVPLIDLQSLAAEQRHRAAARAARIETTRAFDLGRAPLVRGLVIRLASDDHVLLFTLHHIVADGWSMSVLVREFSTLYRGITSGQPVALPPPAVQYPDFATWQRSHVQGDASERMLAHWGERLADLPPTELPGTRHASGRRSGRGASEPLPQAPGLAAAVRSIARRTDATPFVTWVAALAVCLHRCTGQRDIAIGTPIANRLQSDLEGAIGCFVNPLVLRIPVRGDACFDEIVRQARDVSLDAFAHQDVPFERIVERVGARREADGTPLFRVACVFHNMPPGRLELPVVRVTPFAAGSGPARFDLELNVWQSEERLGGSLVYDADLFRPGVAARMLGHLTSLIVDADRRPLDPISSLSILTDAERAQIETWNATRCDRDSRTVVDLIRAKVTQSSQTLAVAAGEHTSSYATLWERACAVAHELRGRGVGRGSRVGLHARRSPDTIAAIVGVLKIGAAYVPLDISSPPDRLRHQLADAGVEVLLADEESVPCAPPDCAVVRIADATSVATGDPANDFRVTIDPDDLAYVIYTSGSTGSPKGVMVTHGGVANYLLWARDTYPLAEGDTTLFHSSLAFDLTVTSVLVPLVAGGTIQIVPEADGLDGLVSAFRQSDDLGFVKVTPSHLRAMADLQEPAVLSGRTRSFVIGGEALDAALVDRWLRAAPGTRLFNEYGPTETVVGCCVQQLGAGDACSDPVPIGTPIANTSLYVVTPHWQLAPVDVVGDLWIGGAGVARGYLDRPDLTADRFVPDAFSGAAGARLYRTGDRVRWCANGVLEYLGRSDHQVKIQGHRVELGEIEAALRELAGVDDAVAIVRGRGAANSAEREVVVGYVAVRAESAGSAAISGDALRQALRARLPEHMVPAAIVPLDVLPLTSNGKVDRRRLPAPPSFEEESEKTSQPRTAAEELLAGIWADVLGAPHVGLHENFFELGGHSLLATRVLSRVREAFGVELALRTMFEAPTVAAMAVRVTDAMTTGRSAQRPEIVPAARGGPAPLSFAQQRLWFVQHLDPDSGFLNVPIALRLRGGLLVPALQQSIAALQQRHEGLRTTFAFEGRALAQRVQPIGVNLLPVVSLEALSPERQLRAARQLVNVETRRPFDLARGPIIRTLLVRCAPDDHVLICAIHHIATDGWSTAILIRDLTTFYQAAVAGAPAPMAAPALQYADYAAWQRAWLSPDELNRQLEYWRRQLEDVKRDEPMFPAKASHAGASRRRGSATIMAGVELTRDLERICRQQHVTLFMTLVAALEVVLHARTGRLAFAIGTDVAGRRDARLETIVGCFINQLVLRADLGGNPTFAELLARVRTAVLAADEHQDLPFEQLVQALQPRREAGRHPIFQVSVVFENTPSAKLDIRDVSVEPFPVRIPETKSDVNLVFIEGSAGVVVRLEYDADLLDGDEASALVEAFRHVLVEEVADPGVRLATLVGRLAGAEEHDSMPALAR